MTLLIQSEDKKVIHLAGAKANRVFRQDVESAIDNAYGAIKGTSVIANGLKALSSELRRDIEEMERLHEESRALQRRLCRPR